MASPLRTGTGAVLVVLIMLIGSCVMWVGAPLLWLWIGAAIQAHSSLGAAVGAPFLGAVLTIVLIAAVLGKLSNFYRANCVARGLSDPGHVVLEMVVVVSAGLALVSFLFCFFFLPGAEPLPVGIKF